MFKGHCFPKSIILNAVYVKLRFGLSYREVEELLQMRNVMVDHATIQRWVFKFSPLLNANSEKERKQYAQAGVWMRPTLKSRVYGSICTGQ